MGEAPEPLFAVLAEKKGYSKALIVTDLTFARLIDDVVKPYDEESSFFIDGVFLKRTELQKLKIIQQSENFGRILGLFHRSLRQGDSKTQKVFGDHYDVRMNAILREGGEDVTSQIIKACDSEIKPKLKDYLPKRDELIQAASKFFWEGVKSLS